MQESGKCFFVEPREPNRPGKGKITDMGPAKVGAEAGQIRTQRQKREKKTERKTGNKKRN